MNIVDTFGRLPSDVIKSIMDIYTLPYIDIVEAAPQNINMQIKYQMLIVKISMIPSLVVGKNCIQYYNVVYNNNIIKTFISDLHNNRNTMYKEGCDYTEGFEIVVDDTIKIITNNSTTVLSIDSKYQLINAMNKYYDILNKYPHT